ncbi:hypothetical protein D3C87_1793290 [compost metagenome]
MVGLLALAWSWPLDWRVLVIAILHLCWLLLVLMAMSTEAERAKLLWLTLPIGFPIVWLVAFWIWAIVACTVFKSCI